MVEGLSPFSERIMAFQKLLEHVFRDFGRCLVGVRLFVCIEGPSSSNPPAGICRVPSRFLSFNFSSQNITFEIRSVLQCPSASFLGCCLILLGCNNLPMKSNGKQGGNGLPCSTCIEATAPQNDVLSGESASGGAWSGLILLPR